MNKITNSAFFVLLISFFVLTSCEKEDSNVGSSLNITLNPGQGLTTANLEGLKLGIVKLPDGTTENDNLDSLTWISEPTWFIDSANTNANIVFKDLTPGIYLAEIDNDTLQLETFNNDTNAIYIQVENGEITNQSVSIVFSEAKNDDDYKSKGDYVDAWGSNVEADKRLLTVTVRFYNKNNTITKTISSVEKYVCEPESPWHTQEIRGQGYHEEIYDLYKIKNFHHCLRDEFYKIEVEIINNNDGTTVTRIVYPKSESWWGYTCLYEELVVGDIDNIRLNIDYSNILGTDGLTINIKKYYEEYAW